MNPNNNGEANQQALVPLNVDYIGSMMSSKREVSSQSILILNSSFVGVPVPPVRMPSLRRQVRSHVDIPSPRPDEQQQDQDQNRKRAGNPGVYIGGEYFYNNYNGSGRGGVPAHRVWREGQIKSTKPTAS